MKVVEIFKSIEGEGKRVGQPAVFIRLHGCNLNCSYCDTLYAHNDSHDYTEMSVDNIVEKVEEYNCNNITITGGEPLIHDNIFDLLSELNYMGYDINIETNGSVDITQFKVFKNVFFTIDYKCKSSGCNDDMCLHNYNILRQRDVVKFVVSDEEDLKDCYKLCKLVDFKSSVYFSPVWGVMDLEKLADFVINCGLDTARMQLQIHKIIWDVNKRGV